MKITKLILAAYLLTSMAACDTDKNIAMYGEDSGAIRIEALLILPLPAVIPVRREISRNNLMRVMRFS